jgi:hypothetical protein
MPMRRVPSELFASAGKKGTDLDPATIGFSLRHGLENAPGFIDAHLAEVLAALPPDRFLSFCEVSLFCLVTQLPFRKVMEVDAFPQLQRFSQDFAARASAQATPYHFDAA